MHTWTCPQARCLCGSPCGWTGGIFRWVPCRHRPTIVRRPHACETSLAKRLPLRHDQREDWIMAGMECHQGRERLDLPDGYSVAARQHQTNVSDHQPNKPMKTKPKQSHHEHMHPLSVVSGVIYLDNNVDNLNLNFVLQNRGAIIPYFIEQDKEAHMSLKTILEMYEHNPITHSNLKNHLILFLSNLKHHVTPTPNNSLPRKSISFNTFWKGMIGKKGNPLGTISFDKVSVLSEHKI